MKKWLFCLTVFGLTACSEKDKEYYLSHIEKAQEKVQQCRQEQEKAFLANNKEQYQAVKNDKECQAAHLAMKEHIQKKEEEERLAKEAKEKAAIEQAKQELNKELSQLNWQETVQRFVNHQCSQIYISNENYECRAFKSIYDERVEDAKKELSKANFTELLTQEKQYCSRDKRKYSACSIWQDVITEVGRTHFSALPFQELSSLRQNHCVYDGRSLAACHIWERVNLEKEKEIVDAYTKDYESLKKDYNQCVKLLAAIDDNWKNIEKRDNIASKYPCPQTMEARSKLGLPYDRFKTPMD
ncbi:hypothetical protein ACWIUA_02635 [Ursidibacter sp. B-7004-1]